MQRLTNPRLCAPFWKGKMSYRIGNSGVSIEWFVTKVLAREAIWRNSPALEVVTQ